MKRRTFLKGTSLTSAAALATAAFPAPALAQGRKELLMVTSWPRDLPGLGTAATELAQRIGVMSDGRYTVRVFAGGELVGPLRTLEAVESGTADLYHSAEYYFQDKSRAFDFFAAVPFGLTAGELNAWIYHGGGQALWDELGGQFNVKPLLAGNTGVQMGGWFRKEINAIKDFKGLKMRIPGLGGAVVDALGGSSVTLAGGDIFAALQSGKVDAAEWIGPWNDAVLGFHKVAKHYYYPGFHEPGTALSLGIGRKLWDGLTKSDQAMFEAAAAAANDRTLAAFNANNAGALDRLINTHKVRLRRFSNDILNALGEASGDVVATVGLSDPLAKRVYESFLKVRRGAISWSKIADRAFINARLLPFKYE
jgi:TRAP-type mannitol/chloroaromatic compound transport system substrate-binding protein